MKISFCTTCSNRLSQFQYTFHANRLLIEKTYDTEWVIVNFASKDQLKPYMEEQLPLCGSNIVYAETYEDIPWHLSVAKNTAHAIATGDILVNLDCDNFIENAIEKVRSFFSQGCSVLHMWSGITRDGTHGRIAIRRSIFEALGGYDEAFAPMGHQDTDLLNRASAMGALVLRTSCDPSAAIRNTKETSIAHCAAGGLAWEDYNSRNIASSRYNLARSILQANSAGGMKVPCRVIHGARTISNTHAGSGL